MKYAISCEKIFATLFIYVGYLTCQMRFLFVHQQTPLPSDDIIILLDKLFMFCDIILTLEFCTKEI